VLFGSDSELVVEGMVPNLSKKCEDRDVLPVIRHTYLLHVVPVRHDTVLNRVLEGEDTTLRLSLVADVRVLLPVTPTLVSVDRHNSRTSD
jgi:hypothetical protein